MSKGGRDEELLIAMLAAKQQEKSAKKELGR